MAKGELVTYFDFAEDDYNFFKKTYDDGNVANSMAAIAQGICEKYLKYLIETETDHKQMQYDSIMRTHNIRKLLRYLEREVPDFSCREDYIMKVDGYYFSTRYPGDESVTVNEKDLKECMDAVTFCREAVVEHIKQRNAGCMEAAVNVQQRKKGGGR